MGQIDNETILKLMESPHPKVRATAVRLTESFLHGSTLDQYVKPLLDLAEKDADPDVQLQLAFTFGQMPSGMAMQGLRIVADRSASRPLVREAIVTGLYGHELDFAEQLASAWRTPEDGPDPLLESLTECVAASRNTTNIEKILEIAAAAPDWQQHAVLAGIGARARAKAKKIYFAAEPKGLAAMSADEKLGKLIGKASELLTWPGQKGYVPPPVIPPLTADEQKSYDLGHSLFVATCAACHQPTGLGAGGVAPPLVDSEWVLGSPERLVRIVLQGAQGPIVAAGVHFDASMPSWATFNDEQIAGILTYIRRDWEQGALPISADKVKTIRQANASHEGQWTSVELSKIH
jgi:mono/diheme cytochrome c family protein